MRINTKLHRDSEQRSLFVVKNDTDCPKLSDSILTAAVQIS